MYCEILMSMLGYSSSSLFDWKQAKSQNSQNIPQKRFSRIGTDIRQLTERKEDFFQTRTEIKKLLLKFGDEVMIDSHSKINSMLESMQIK